MRAALMGCGNVDLRLARERVRNRRRREAKAAAEGREVRSYVRGRSSAEVKRLARLCAKPGFKPIKVDAHVRLWSALERARLDLAEKQRAQAERTARQLHSAHVSCWRTACEAHYKRHLYRTRDETNARQKLRARLRKVEMPDAQLASNVATYVKSGKFMKRWCVVLGYSLADLVHHLKRTLPKGRTWEDFLNGSLHIDHITPRSAFNLSHPAEMRACWSLANLRLLGARDNLSKGARLEVLL